MIKFGFEREYFVHKNDKLVLPPHGMPRDGVLAEARGEPHSHAVNAAYLLMAQQRCMEMRNPGYVLQDDLSFAKVPRELRIKSSRTESKGLTRYQNLYGHERHKHRVTEMTAGLHISITRSVIERIGKRTKEVNGVFDFPQLFRMLDNRYAIEIANAKRRPGFYEIKVDGRVEYRSLPQNIDIVEVAEFLMKNTHVI